MAAMASYLRLVELPKEDEELLEGLKLLELLNSMVAAVLKQRPEAREGERRDEETTTHDAHRR